jgi:NADPH-dependent 2,4-dienoyl-CoA reductase/sulfur reductase-like enzyme
MPRLSDPRFAPDCAIVVDGDRVPARRGESVTSALLAAGRPLVSRSPKYHRPRGPFCLSGSCAACLVRVDGQPNVRACETPCREGLAIETQNALGTAAHDLLRAIDLFTPGGIDHHHMGTWSQLASRITVGASRQLAGLGHLADRVSPSWPAAEEEPFEALVVGSGPAGLGAAEALAKAGRRVLVAEKERAAGGRLRCRLDLPRDPPLAWAGQVATALRTAGGELSLEAAVLGLWPDEGGARAAVIQQGEPPRLRLVRARRVVLASGTWAQPPVFDRNDLPGVFGARGLLVALAEDGVVPGERAAVLGAGAEAEAIAARLAAAGMKAEVVAGEVTRGRGGRRLAALELADGRRIRCDTLAVATPRMPAAELAREVGAALELDATTGAFRVRPEPDGRIAHAFWAAGEVAGPLGAADAAEAGRRAGEAAAHG